jgi:hypothetical protein
MQEEKEAAIKSSFLGEREWRVWLLSLRLRGKLPCVALA